MSKILLIVDPQVDFVNGSLPVTETRGGFTLLYKGNNITKEEYSIMQNEESASVICRLVEAMKIEQLDVCGLAGNICVLDTAKDLKKMLPNTKLNILEEYAPSLDDGSMLKDFINGLI